MSELPDPDKNPTMVPNHQDVGIAEGHEIPSHPDYYKRIIAQTKDGRRVVVASKMPPDVQQDLHLVFEVDQAGLPVPEPSVEAVGVVNLNQSKPITPKGDDTPESIESHEEHFRLGGARVSMGLYELETGNFVPFWDREAIQQVIGGERDSNTLLEIATPVSNEQPDFSAICEVALGIANRDWPDVNSRHNPERLAHISAEYAVMAFRQAGLADFKQESNQPIEDTPVYKQVAAAIADGEVWERVRGKRHQETRETFLKNLEDSILYISDGEHRPAHSAIWLQLSSVVGAVISPSMQRILAKHADDLLRIELEEKAAADARHEDFLK